MRGTIAEIPDSLFLYVDPDDGRKPLKCLHIRGPVSTDLCAAVDPLDGSIAVYASGVSGDAIYSSKKKLYGGSQAHGEQGGALLQRGERPSPHNLASHLRLSTNRNHRPPCPSLSLLRRLRVTRPSGSRSMSPERQRSRSRGWIQRDGFRLAGRLNRSEAQIVLIEKEPCLPVQCLTERIE